MKLKNDRFIRALNREPVDKTPIWIMRQAGRYLPEYREVRNKAGNFMALCSNPELACEVTLQPIRRFDLDAAILFSDILTIPDAMGLGLHFVENEGPKFHRPIENKTQILKLGLPDPELSLKYVMDAVRLIKKELQDRLPLIGFSGSPWTISTYMVEGGTSKTFQKIKGLMYNDPKSMHLLLAKLSDAIIAYLSAQIDAGVDAVMIFDTWGGILTPRDYQTFSLQYMQRIVAEIAAKKVPVTLFTKNGGCWADAIADTGCQAIGVDWTSDLAEIRQKVGHKVALQGNMDPCVLHANAERIEDEVKNVLASYGKGAGHIFNLGHGIHPDVNPELVEILVNSVHKHSIPYHKGEKI